MAGATRAATRAFFHLGNAARLTRTYQQRRLITNTIPALLQISSKRRFLDISILPVNKYDLNGLGIITTTSPSFSTESLQSLTDEASSDDVDEDSESGMERKWPSPITQVVRQHTAFVGGYNLNLNELSSLLSSEFGSVKSVFIPKSRFPVELNEAEGKYQYVFVDFEDKSSLQKALKAGKLVTADNNTIDIKERSKSRRQQEIERTFTVTNLPKNVTVEQINDYFRPFAKVQLMSLVIKPNPISGTEVIAFVVFDKNSEIQGITRMEHMLNNKVINVAKSGSTTRQQRRDRAKKIIVEGLSNDVKEEDTKRYFDSLAPTKSVFYLKNVDSNEFTGMALIEFEDTEAAILVSEKQFQDMNGCNVQVRRLGLCNE